MSASSGPSPNDTSIFDERESNIRNYCRWFPTVFRSARGSEIIDETGRRYIDFFAGAGALNYGHNNEAMCEQLVEYLRGGGLVHALDMFSSAKRAFLETFSRVILEPRGMKHRIQFCGPTGADAVEAALKLARLATGRTQVCYFSGGWHGMTLGCLSINSNRAHRACAGVPALQTTPLPFPVGPRPAPWALDHIESMLADPWSGLDLPAAIVIEGVQAEGGVYVAPAEFLRGLRTLCDRHGILLIVDDIQAGCGRTGPFFSFEPAGIEPDVVLLSKSLSGFGLPMSVVLIRPDRDVWKPGQHTATFRGHQLAFVTATAALEHWKNPRLQEDVLRKGQLVERTLKAGILARHRKLAIRGAGLLWGLDFSLESNPRAAESIVRKCFELGLLLECCGRGDSVIKLLPPLTIPDDQLLAGLEILAKATGSELGS